MAKILPTLSEMLRDGTIPLSGGCGSTSTTTPRTSAFPGRFTPVLTTETIGMSRSCEKIRIPQATASGWIYCNRGGVLRHDPADERNPPRKGAAWRRCMPYADERGNADLYF